MKCKDLFIRGGKTALAALSLALVTSATSCTDEVEHINRPAVLTIVEAFMDTVKESMQGGEEVYLRGFGSFILKHRAAKTARDISKNVTVIVPEHDIPAFKPAKEFMEAVRKF